MKVYITLFTLILHLFCMNETTAAKNLVKMSTSYGDILIRLYDETPQHRDNFIKLVKEGYYDSTLFHRVIRGFMIQTGDPDSKGAPTGRQLGTGGPSYQIPAEIKFPELYHKRGALAAARTGDNVNPMKESSGSQFYIVWGSTYIRTQLEQMEQKLQQSAMTRHFQNLVNQNKDSIVAMQNANDRAGLNALQTKLAAETEKAFKNSKEDFGYTEEQKKVYSTIGGTPFLDGEYTVFGEVVEGLSIIEKIQAVATDSNDRPKKDIQITMTLVEE